MVEEDWQSTEVLIFPNFSTSTVGWRIPGRHMAPPRMKAGGWSYVEEVLSGRPQRGGTAGTTSVARHSLRQSTAMYSCQPPSSRVKALGPRDSTRYGPSYNGDSSGPGAPRLMNLKSAEERVWGDVSVGGGPLRALLAKLTKDRRRFSSKLVASGSAVSSSSPDRAKGTQ